MAKGQIQEVETKTQLEKRLKSSIQMQVQERLALLSQRPDLPSEAA